MPSITHFKTTSVLFWGRFGWNKVSTWSLNAYLYLFFTLMLSMHIERHCQHTRDRTVKPPPPYYYKSLFCADRWNKIICIFFSCLLLMDCVMQWMLPGLQFHYGASAREILKSWSNAHQRCWKQNCQPLSFLLQNHHNPASNDECCPAAPSLWQGWRGKRKNVSLWWAFRD